MAEYEQAVFISYAWGEEREAIVNELDETLQQRGIRIIRDKRALGYRGSIKEFMERIGRGSCIIVVISDKYLRSPNCMFELVEIAENKQFHDRVFPIVLSDANIYDPLKRIEYVKHWEGKRKELAKAMKTLDPANLHGIREEMDEYDRIRDKISGITSILKDMNTLTPDMHRGSEFSNLYDAIVERLREGSGDSTAEQDRLAAQKPEEDQHARAAIDRLAAQQAKEQYEVKEKVVSVETKATPVAVAPVQKKPASGGMVFGIAAAVVLIICIATGWFLFSSGALNFLSQGNNTNVPASTPTLAPTATQILTPTTTPTKAINIQWLRQLYENPIIQGVGLAGMELGMREEMVRGILGSPTQSGWSEDGINYHLSYVYKGIWLIFYARGDVQVNRLRLWDDDFNKDGYIPTLQGITIGSSESELLSALGEPISKDEHSTCPESLSSTDTVTYEYDGISFWVCKANNLIYLIDIP